MNRVSLITGTMFCAAGTNGFSGMAIVNNLFEDEQGNKNIEEGQDQEDRALEKIRAKEEMAHV